MSNAIGPKVEHVLAEARKKHDAAHHCHWPNCPRPVPPAMWGCKAHWFKLPPDIRSAIWASYKPCQEQSKTPSALYIAAAKRAQEWIKGYLQQFPDPVKPKPEQGKLL